MMTAEKWYEHHDNYRKYGFDMKPKQEKTVSEYRNSFITTKDKVIIIFYLLLIGILCGMLIVSAAYTARVKHEINTVRRDNAQIVGVIENLNVDIKNATNLRTIEEKAIEELGMIYPLPEQFVFLSRPERPSGDFAMLLKEQAFN